MLFVVEAGNQVLAGIDKGRHQHAHNRSEAVSYALRIQPPSSPRGILVWSLLGILQQRRFLVGSGCDGFGGRRTRGGTPVGAHLARLALCSYRTRIVRLGGRGGSGRENGEGLWGRVKAGVDERGLLLLLGAVYVSVHE